MTKQELKQELTAICTDLDGQRRQLKDARERAQILSVYDVLTELHGKLVKLIAAPVE